MPKALFSLFRKKESTPAAPAAPIVPPLPEATVCVEPEVMPGNTVVSYGTLTGHGRRHYTEIFLDPALLPRVRLSMKPDNKEYLTLKHDLLDKAYHGLKPFTDFACSLKGMAGRPDLHDALRDVLTRFLTRYWDMPASNDNHHSYPWGFVLHSLDVACGEAEAATDWLPMSEHGIDEMGHAQDLGTVVLMHFGKGLFHDAYKLYQYGMTWRGDTNEVVFSPFLHEGNVLDFKLVYPAGYTETWGAVIQNPGKLNAVEFMGVIPRKLWGYIPKNVFFDVITALFDLVPSDADRESARRDATRAGRMTIEEMIFAAVKHYFADKGKTNPGLNVFRMNGEWSAVNAAQFFLKVRPAGGVFTADGVRSCLMDQGLLAGNPQEADQQFHFFVRFENGKHRIDRNNHKIAFLKTSFLLEACPDLTAVTGEIVFEEKDRARVCALCPSADNFIEKFPEEKPEKTAPQGKQNDVEPPDGAKGKSTPIQAKGPAQKVAVSVAAEESPETAISAPAPVNWVERLQGLLVAYTIRDSSREGGWLFCNREKAYVRLSLFYPLITGIPDLLERREEWRELCRPMQTQLVAEGHLQKERILSIEYIAPGGEERTLTGSFLELSLPQKLHNDILILLYKSAASDKE